MTIAPARVLRVPLGGPRVGVPSSQEREGWQTLSRILAASVPFLLGVDLPLVRSLTIGMALSLALAPLWAGQVRTYRGVSLLLAPLAVAVPTAPLLTQWSTSDHTFDVTACLHFVFIYLGIAGAVGALLWSRRFLQDGAVCALYGAGMMVGTLVHPGPLFATEPWRWGLAMPTTLLALGVAARLRHARWELLAAIALAIAGALAGGRSDSGILVMVAALLVWQHRPSLHRRSSSAMLMLALVALLGFGAYRALEGAALEGYLGQAAQERTQLQIQQSGSLILGGRPEAGASFALFVERPWGYGPGIVPSPDDLKTVKEGMASVGADPNTGYVEVYMLGRSVFEMHSVTADLWTTLGLPGLGLALGAACLALRYLARGLAHRAGSAVGTFLALRLLWDLGFSPLHSSVPNLMLGLAVILLPRAEGRSRGREEGASAEAPEPPHPMSAGTRTRPSPMRP